VNVFNDNIVPGRWWRARTDFSEPIPRRRYLTHGARLAAVNCLGDLVLHAVEVKEFRFGNRGDGRARLEGSSWYELEMAPDAYWQVFSDKLIPAFHQRVRITSGVRWSPLRRLRCAGGREVRHHPR